MFVKFKRSIESISFHLKADQAGWRSVESVVELVGELVVFSTVSFTHHLSYSAHGAPGRKDRTERGRGRQEMRGHMEVVCCFN